MPWIGVLILVLADNLGWALLYSLIILLWD